MAGHGRDIRGRRSFLAFDLVAHRRDGFGIGPDEDNAGIRQRGCEGFAFGEEPVTRMHRLGAGCLAGGDNLVDHQIALRGRRRTDQDGLVSHLDMQRIAVGFGIDRDGFNAHPAGGLDDPAGDFAAIGNQDSLEHVRYESRKPALWLCGAAVKKSITAAAVPISPRAR